MSSSGLPFMDLYSSKAMTPESHIYLLLPRLGSILFSSCFSSLAMYLALSPSFLCLLEQSRSPCWLGTFLDDPFLHFFPHNFPPWYGIRYFDVNEQKLILFPFPMTPIYIKNARVRMKPGEIYIFATRTAYTAGDSNKILYF